MDEMADNNLLILCILLQRVSVELHGSPAQNQLAIPQ